MTSTEQMNEAQKKRDAERIKILSQVVVILSDEAPASNFDIIYRVCRYLINKEIGLQMRIDKKSGRLDFCPSCRMCTDISNRYCPTCGVRFKWKDE